MRQLIPFFIGIAFIFFGTSMNHQSVENSTGLLLDTLGNSVHVVHHDSHLPRYYESDVFTPVCHTGECLPIEITIRWDLGGDFHEFELKDGEILTKIDHIPFTDSDYRMLQNLLENDRSALRDYSYADLIYKGKDTVNQKVDGVSGATITGLKGHYVPDALFTTHTLWHLVNGSVRQKLAAYTRDVLFESTDLSYFIGDASLNCQRAALKELSCREQRNLVSVLETILDTADTPLSLFALEELGRQFTTSNQARQLLSSYYQNTSNEASKRKILLAYEAQELMVSEIEVIAAGFGKYYSLFTIECKVLDKQQDWPKTAYEHILAFVDQSQNLQRKEKAFSLLRIRKDHFSRSMLRRYKKVAKDHFLRP